MIKGQMRMDYKVRYFLKMDYILQYLLKMIYLFFDETDANYASGYGYCMSVAGDGDDGVDDDDGDGADDDGYYVIAQCDDLMLREYAF